MLWERIRTKLIEVWILLYMIYHAKRRWQFARLRREGRQAEVDAIVLRMITVWADLIFGNLRCRLEVEGLEHVPRDEPFVVFANHQSKYDIPALVGGLRMAIGFVVKKELFYIPGVSFWMRQIGCFSLDRGDIAGGAAALTRLGETIKQSGTGFIIFPEGTRTRDPERRIQPFRLGSARLVAEHGLPVLPVVIDGTRLLDLNAPMQATRDGGRVARIRVLPLRRLDGSGAPARKAFMDAVYEALRSNWEAIRVNWPQS